VSLQKTPVAKERISGCRGAGWREGRLYRVLGGEKRENIIAVARSANDCLSPDHVKAAELAFQGANPL
jgi:hypothetical protein